MVFIKSALLAAAVAPWAHAYPQVQSQKSVEPTRRAPKFLSGRSNTGIFKSEHFDAQDQYVDVTDAGAHPFKAPGKNDLRGECPGLNAAANHGFLPRNGIASVAQTVDGLQEAFNMGPDLSAFLALVSVAFVGDLVTRTWSIGGAYQGTLPGLLGKPRGLLGAHNKYEGDASIGRGDAYMNGGNQILSMRSFKHLMELGPDYTLDVMAAQNDYVNQWSRLNNPYYFSAPFAGLVTPAAHEFVINFMSNHSEQAPSGTLNRDIIKTFFAVTGDGDDMKYQVSQERFPENWYKRPSANKYTIVKNVADTVIAGLMYPGVVAFGGNTGKPNTFTGVDIGNLTGGVFNSATLLQGDNLACFFMQLVQAGFVDNLTGAGGNLLQGLLTDLTDITGPLLQELACPSMKTMDSGLFNQYPGYHYSPANPSHG